MSKNKKTNAMRILDRLKIDYEEIVFSDDSFLTATEAADKLGHDPKSVYKTIVTISKTKENYVFVIRGDKEIDLKKAAKSVEEKSISPIKVTNLKELTGYIKGGCSPIGMKKQFKTIVDEDALDNEFIYISGGKRGVEIKIRPLDLKKAINCEFKDIKDEN
ncbi:MAG: Cys-tRNA(Pro) deacylase [Tissierellia bacterium]|nr:Cys-tRNA(Pro) deacylase [Tissierellia bacterium]